jgi:UDP-N-acetyl-D-galactosamine dehydrogenase
MISNKRIAVIGGYVGLPLQRLFATKYPVDSTSIKAGLMDYFPVRIVLEISDEVLQAVLLDKTHVAMMVSNSKKKKLTNHQINGLYCSATLSDIADCNYYIITVPTPVDKITVRI